MKRILFALVLALAAPAGASTIVAAAGQPFYLVGDVITVSFIGDPEGSGISSCEATVAFDEALAEGLTFHQEPFTTNGNPWIRFRSEVGGGIYPGGFIDIFNQESTLYDQGIGPDGPTTSVITLRAVAPGELVLRLTDASDPPARRTSFFGDITYEPLHIVIVPEPGTAMLLALGLVAMASRCRAPEASA